MIACHAGAGYHSSSLEAAYKRDLAAACQAGAAALAGGADALAAVTAAIKLLEDSNHCNAGNGSNCSFNGVVECDASVMAGDGTFGAVAAAPGIQNPVEAAALLARESRQPLSNGRVRPMMLAGDRAREWARSRGLPAAPTAAEAASWHLTERSQRQWRKYRQIVDSSTDRQQQEQQQQGEHAQERNGAGRPPARDDEHAESQRAAKRARRQQPYDRGAGGGQGSPQPQQPQASDEASCFYDTVGCVVLAPDGSIAAGVSSGGIVLKTEGRVGEAALYGAGCWAQQPEPAAAVPQQQQLLQAAAAEPLLACSVTGVGEHVMRHLLARECCRAAAAAAAAGEAGASASGASPTASPASSMGGVALTADGPASSSAASEGEGPPPLAEVAAALLQRTILRGPPPHDCGLLCLKAQPLGPAGARGATCANGSAAAAGTQQQQQQQQQQQEQQQRPPGQRFAVEVAVAHSAQSMAIGHMACGGGGSGGAGKQQLQQQQQRLKAAPAVMVLRRQATCGGRPPVEVQTYMHGTVVQL